MFSSSSSLVCLFFLFFFQYVIDCSNIYQYIPMGNDTQKYSNNSNNELGICYGSSTQWSQYPWIVALRTTSGSACCSGSIVSLNPPVILSAAHCSSCTGAVRIGCNNPSNCDGDSYPISQWVTNPGYGSPLSMSNDIAVVRLSRTITTSGATAIGIPSQEMSSGNLRIVGYGITQTGSIPSSLQTASMAIVPRSTCSTIMTQALGGGSYIDNSMICIRGGNAGQANVPSTCSGDSGGPWSSGSQFGVTSWGLQGSGTGCTGCSCCTGYPSVGANVAAFSSWIRGYLGLWSENNSTVV